MHKESLPISAQVNICLTLNTIQQQTMLHTGGFTKTWMFYRVWMFYRLSYTLHSQSLDALQTELHHPFTESGCSTDWATTPFTHFDILHTELHLHSHSLTLYRLSCNLNSHILQALQTELQPPFTVLTFYRLSYTQCLDGLQNKPHSYSQNMLWFQFIHTLTPIRCCDSVGFENGNIFIVYHKLLGCIIWAELILSLHCMHVWAICCENSQK